MPPQVLTFLKLPPPLHQLLAEYSTVTTWEDQKPPTVADLKQFVKTFDAILTTPRVKVTEEIVHATTKTKVFSQYAVGYDNLDVAAILQQQSSNCRMPLSPPGFTIRRRQQPAW